MGCDVAAFVCHTFILLSSHQSSLTFMHCPAFQSMLIHADEIFLCCNNIFNTIYRTEVQLQSYKPVQSLIQH